MGRKREITGALGQLFVLGCQLIGFIVVAFVAYWLIRPLFSFIGL